MNTVLETLNDEEMEDFSKLVRMVLKEVCNFSDKHNLDRDSMLTYLGEKIVVMSEIATIKNYKE